MRAIEKRLREKLKSVEAELAEVKNDREKFRIFWVALMRESIRIHGEGKTWNMSALIERLAKHLTAAQSWYW